MNKFQARIKDIQELTPTVKGFCLALENTGFQYIPGQWIDLWVDMNGKTEVGGYSVVGFENGVLELAVKASEHHQVTQFLHQQAEVGTPVTVSEAQGECIYTPDVGQKIVLIAGGIGVTPLMSIFRTIRDHEPDTQVAMLYSAKTPDEFAFADEIKEAADTKAHVLAAFTCTDLEAELPDWVHFQERIDSFFLKTMNLPEDAVYYICGPSPMIRELEETLLTLGVAAGNIRYEKW